MLNKHGICEDYNNELNQLAGYLSYYDLIREKPEEAAKLKNCFAIERIQLRVDPEALAESDDEDELARPSGDGGDAGGDARPHDERRGDR